MKSLLLFILDVSVAWVLVVGGMAVAFSLAESPSAGCFLGPLAMLPALLFMKLRVPFSWGRFVASECAILGTGLLTWTLVHFGLPMDWSTRIAILSLLLVLHVTRVSRRKKDIQRAGPSAEKEA